MDDDSTNQLYPILGSRFQEALIFATQLHAKQARKGTGIPYIAHLLSVTALVLEAGGDEDEAIAALLHDSAEDQGGRRTLEEIRLRFGSRVADLVDGLTDTYDCPKPPWRERKERYIANLRQACPAVRRISLSDKLHNARSIIADLNTDGGMVWERFKGGKDGSLWYYRTLVELYKEMEEGYLIEELARVVSEIENLAALKK
jgi:(p)ppGpp synthase/HD superfamily hydrolase